MPADPDQLAAFRATARSLLIDRATVEAVMAMREAGLEPILIKGPATAALLYPGETRPYADADLLVDPALRPAAQRVLTELGYDAELEDDDVPEYHRDMWHAQPWRRSTDGARVDLHAHLMECTQDPTEGWAVLSEHTAALTLCGTPVTTLDAPGQALVTALHLAHHGATGDKPSQDLDRAVRTFDEGAWRTAHQLSVRLGAAGSFALGLRLTPQGTRLAETLGLPDADHGNPQTQLEHSFARAFGRLAATPGLRSKAAVLRLALLPPAGWLERGEGRQLSRSELAGAYVARLGRLARHLGPSWRAWRRSHRR